MRAAGRGGVRCRCAGAEAAVVAAPRTQTDWTMNVTTFLRHHPSFVAGPRGQSLESPRQQLILPRTVHALALGATGQSAWVRREIV